MLVQKEVKNSVWIAFELGNSVFGAFFLFFKDIYPNVIQLQMKLFCVWTTPDKPLQRNCSHFLGSSVCSGQEACWARERIRACQIWSPLPNEAKTIRLDLMALLGMLSRSFHNKHLQWPMSWQLLHAQGPIPFLCAYTQYCYRIVSILFSAWEIIVHFSSFPYAK